MFSLNRSTGYAILAMACLDDPEGKATSIPALAELSGIPRPFMGKLIARLAANQLVHTRRGCGGGVLLTRPRSEITIHQIISSLEHAGWDKGCFFGLDHCDSNHTCTSHELWVSLRSRAVAHLRKTTLKDLDPRAKGQDWDLWACTRPTKCDRLAIS